MLTYIAIIGTAGRNKILANEMTKALFENMVTKAKHIIEHELKLSLSNVHLVSGGAAWSGMYM